MKRCCPHPSKISLKGILIVVYAISELLACLNVNSLKNNWPLYGRFKYLADCSVFVRISLLSEPYCTSSYKI